MGAEHFAKVPEWVLYADISAQAVRCYGVLDRYADEHRVCWPSRVTLAELMRGCSVATVQRALNDLKRIGAIDIEPRYTPAGDRTSNRYRVHLTPRQGELWETSGPPTTGAPGSTACAPGVGAPVHHDPESVNQSQVIQETSCPQSVEKPANNIDVMQVLADALPARRHRP